MSYRRPVKRLLWITVVAAACSGGTAATTSTTPTSGSAVVPAKDKVLVNVNSDGIGLDGYDPVAYRTFNKPVTGLPEHTREHAGAIYRFSSADNAAAFTSEQAPAYGGYCAYAASLGQLSPADPLAFEIYEGQLLVFTDAEYKRLFDQDPAGNKAKADAAWPGLVAQHGK